VDKWGLTLLPVDQSLALTGFVSGGKPLNLSGLLFSEGDFYLIFGIHWSV
jgi:hypothetical protein